MAEDVTAPESVALAVPDAPPADAVAAEPAASRWSMPHRNRFAVVYGLLGAVLALAIVGVAVYAGRSISPAPAWSTWQPSGGGLGAVQQIAGHVSPEYRLPSGNQLVDVIARNPSFSPDGAHNVDLHDLALRGPKGKVDSILPMSSSNSAMFSMCGLGPNCSIATGTASVARGRLVRREILELALYTFKYIGGIDNVVAFMPPRPGTTPQYAVYLRKADLAADLHHPLVQTLRAKTPLPNTIPAHEVQAIDMSTEARTFKFGVVQTQFGDWALVLAPLTA